MLKAQYERRGPVPEDVIAPVEFEAPPLAPGQALLEVLAAPINPSDVLTLTGEYGMLPPLPAVGGNEGVGRIVAKGDDAGSLPVGQTVLLPVGIGTWATHVVAEAKRLVPLPNEADALQLSMITVNPPTAALMLREFVDLQPGEWVLQNAANSAVGSYLIQLAKSRGLKTVNVVRRENALAGLERQGADVVIVDGDDLPRRVADATGRAKIRLGIDAVAGKATGRLSECLAEGGVLVNYGAMSGEPCVVAPRSFVFRDVTLRGFWLAKWFRTATPAEQMELYGGLTARIVAGELKAPVAATYDVADIREAVAAAARGERDGKILVVPRR